MNKWLKYDFKGNDLIDFGNRRAEKQAKKGNAYASKNGSASGRMKMMAMMTKQEMTALSSLGSI